MAPLPAERAEELAADQRWLFDHTPMDSAGYICPLDAEFLAYIRRQTATLVREKPDFVMVDDDTRIFQTAAMAKESATAAVAVALQSGMAAWTMRPT